jgi:putative exosortase-associated protein (TIGR04073 family)
VNPADIAGKDSRITDHVSRFTPPLCTEKSLYNPLNRANLGSGIQFMRNIVSLLALLAVIATFSSGCANYGANVERKFGRGVANTAEIVRGGEFRRTMEQTALFNGGDAAYSTGFFRGINRSVARTGLGVIEIATAPLPFPRRDFGPLATDHFAPGPVYPDNFTPGVAADSMFATDTEIGFGGGDVIPIIPGSRFRIFESH